jgi:hypothetical protein
MCSIRSGVGSARQHLDQLSLTGPFVKLQGYLGGQTVKQEFEERALMMGSPPYPRGRSLAGSSGLAQMRFVATGPNGSSEAESPIRPVAPTRYRKAKALLMSGTRISMRTRWPLKVPLQTVVSYFARPDGFASLGSTEVPPGLRFFRRETTVLRRLGAPPGCWFFSHPSAELRLSNADPCSPAGGPDRRGSSAGAVGDVR